MFKKQHPSGLTAEEKQKPYAEFFYRNPEKIPETVIAEIQKSPYPHEHALLFEKMNDLLNPGYLPIENGFCQMADGSVFVAVLT